jgi:hypothetical protein
MEKMMKIKTHTEQTDDCSSQCKKLDIFLERYGMIIAISALVAFSLASAIYIYREYTDSFASIFPAIPESPDTKPSRADWGVTGDFFGGLLNPVFSFLGLIMLLATLLQNQKELELSRKELTKSSEALKEQSVTMEKQRFEDTFFSMVDQLSNMQKNITEKQTIYSGSGAASLEDSIALNLRNEILSGLGGMPGLRTAKQRVLQSSYEINQYFRFLYQLLKFISNNCPDSEIKGKFSVENLRGSNCSQTEKIYSNIVRAFITDDIYFLLAVNCFCANDEDLFFSYRLLVERYAMLEHIHLLPMDQYAIKKQIVSHYSRNAFGNNPKYEQVSTM